MSERSTIDILPSGFIPYKNLGINHILIRSFINRELKILDSYELPETETIKIYNDAILNLDIYDQLSWPDFLFISSHITLFTNNEQKWKHKYVCEYCANLNESTLDRNNFFEFNDMDIPGYPIKVKLNNTDLEFGVITVNNHLDYIKTYKKIDSKLRGIYTTSYRIKNMPQPEAYKFLLELSNKDEIETIKKIEKMLVHGVKPLECICQNKDCAKTSKIRTGVGLNTIVPCRQNKKSSEIRITFGE